MQRNFGSAPKTFSRLFKTIKKRTSRIKKPDMRGRHTKESRLLRLKLIKENLPKMPSCASCEQELDYAITTDDGNALVCKYCGVVDAMPIFDTDYVPVPCIPGSPLYRHRYYFGERILQARNREPRLSDDELDSLSLVYNIYKSSKSVFWYEGVFTKRHMSMICRHLVKRYPKSFWTRRIERWFQYRTYICGQTGLQLQDDVAQMLRFLFDAYSRYFQIYVDNFKGKKTNITQLDMVILVLLYSISPDYLPIYGWYFLNRNLINMTPSVYKNYEVVKTVCATVNERILHEYDNTIPKMCYQWFRLGNKLTVPDLEDLVDGAMGSELGAVQYANYKKGNTLGAYMYYKRYEEKLRTE